MLVAPGHWRDHDPLEGFDAYRRHWWCLVILAVTYSPVLWVLVMLVAAIDWSRVAIRDHTSAQVIGGAIIGAIVGGGLYAALI